MAFDSDPCPDDADSGSGNQIAIIIGVVLGVIVLALCAAMFLWRMKTVNDGDGSSYDSSKSYSDDEEFGSQYMSQSSAAGSYQNSPRMQLMPGSFLPQMGPGGLADLQMMGPMGSYNYAPPQTPYGQFGTSASAGPMQPPGFDPLQYGGSQYGGYDSSQMGMGGMPMPNFGMGGNMGGMSMDGMGLPPPVFAQGMGSGAMAGGSPQQGFYMAGASPRQGFGGSAMPQGNGAGEREL